MQLGKRSQLPNLTKELEENIFSHQILTKPTGGTREVVHVRFRAEFKEHRPNESACRAKIVFKMVGSRGVFESELKNTQTAYVQR